MVTYPSVVYSVVASVVLGSKQAHCYSCGSRRASQYDNGSSWVQTIKEEKYNFHFCPNSTGILVYMFG